MSNSEQKPHSGGESSGSGPHAGTAGTLRAELDQAILERRARELAKAPEDKPTDSSTLEIVEFKMAHEHYGVETKWVREVLPLKSLTPLPGTPPHVLGIVNLRGRVISLLDLKKFFTLPERGLAETSLILVLHAPEMEFGVLADAIAGVRRVSRDGLCREIPTFSGQRKEFLLGVCGDGTVILDGERILGDPNIVVRDRAL